MENQKAGHRTVKTLLGLAIGGVLIAAIVLPIKAYVDYRD